MSNVTSSRVTKLTHISYHKKITKKHIEAERGIVLHDLMIAYDLSSALLNESAIDLMS